MSLNLSNYLENKINDLVLRNTAIGSITTVYLALFTALSDDGTSVTEVSSYDYARVAITFGASSGGVMANSASILFPAANGGNFGTITHVGIYDAVSGGNLLAWGNNADIVCDDGETVSCSIGALELTLSGAMLPIADALLDHIFRNQSWTAVTAVYVALMASYTNPTTHTELTGNDYIRKVATFDASSGGVSANSGDITFDDADPSGWGTPTHLALFNAESTGTLLAAWPFDSAPTINAGKTFRILQGDLTVTAT